MGHTSCVLLHTDGPSCLHFGSTDDLPEIKESSVTRGEISLDHPRAEPWAYGKSWMQDSLSLMPHTLAAPCARVRET